MVRTKMGRYWEQTKGWFACKMWPFKTKSGCETKVSKMRPTCKSPRMSDSQRASAVRRKRAAGNTGPKPTNVKTFAKRAKAASGGSIGDKMIRQAQKNYIGSYVSGDLGGVKVGNKSYKKYYSNPGFRMPKIS